ncbi:MAG: hypothetical protein R2690_13195 [Acidimicrobiales bacterium]
MGRDVGQGHVALEHLFGDDGAERRVELGCAARQQRGLARTRSAGEHDGQPALHAGAEEASGGIAEHVALDQLVELAEGHPGELADVDHGVAAAAHVAVHDVQACARVELGVLEPVGRVELAMAGAGVVEDLGQDPHDVVVVVEDLVVVAVVAAVSLDEDLGRCVDHDLPHVVVGEQRLEGSVAGEVAHGPLDQRVARREVCSPSTAAVLLAPVIHLVLDQTAQQRDVHRGVLGCEVLDPGEHLLLDLLQRRAVARGGLVAHPAASSNQVPNDPGVMRAGASSC